MIPYHRQTLHQKVSLTDLTIASLLEIVLPTERFINAMKLAKVETLFQKMTFKLL